MQGQRLQAKVVLLGEGRVGKTSLVLRFCKDTYSESQAPTIQASFLDKTVSVGDSRVSLAIWDTAGQERFHALGPIYYRDADSALLVFDITDPDSFIKVKSWVKELRKMVRCHAGPHACGRRSTPRSRPLRCRWVRRSFCASLATNRIWRGTGSSRGKKPLTMRWRWERSTLRPRRSRAEASTSSSPAWPSGFWRLGRSRIAPEAAAVWA